MTKKLWFQVGTAILFTLLIIFMFMQVKSIFSPFMTIAQAIFMPLLLGGVLFYLARPLQKWLESKKFPRWASIISVFVVIGLLIWGFIALLSPVLTKQVNALVDNTPEMIEEVEEFVNYSTSQWKKIGELPDAVQTTIERASGKIETIAVSAGGLIVKFIQNVFQGVFLLVLVPFFLVYMLKDHENLSRSLHNFLKGRRGPL